MSARAKVKCYPPPPPDLSLILFCVFAWQFSCFPTSRLYIFYIHFTYIFPVKFSVKFFTKILQHVDFRGNHLSFLLAKIIKLVRNQQYFVKNLRVKKYVREILRENWHYLQTFSRKYAQEEKVFLKLIFSEKSSQIWCHPNIFFKDGPFILHVADRRQVFLFLQ